MRKIGILGGTFDPVHNGHIAIAHESLSRLELDKVIFVPASRQPLKDRDSIAPVERRLNMVSLAIDDNPQFELSTLETGSTTISFTVDTLKILEQQYKGKAELYFILGWDSLMEMPRWKTPQEIIKLCKIIAFTRSNLAPPAIKELDRQIPGLSERLIIIDIPPIDISSSDVRQHVKQGLSIHDMVPQKVEDYIIKNNLYR